MSRSNYAVSDFLVDRHPAKEEPFGNGINAKENTIAFGQRAIPKLIELLKVPDLNVKEKQDALKNILSLDLAHQETKIYAVQQGLIESMRDCIYDSNPIVKAQAIEVIGKLSTLRQAQERIAAEQVIPLLLDALNDVANVSIAACNTLQKLSTTHNACLMLIKHKTVSHMIPIIANSTVDATLARSLETIVALTSASDDAIADALACDILPALQKVVTSQPELVMKCCSNLAKHMKGKEALVKANMLPTCAQLLHHKSHFVQQRALSAIMLLCIVVDAKKQACEIPMLIDHLVYILVVGEDGHELDVQYAKATLILLNEYPRGRAEVERCVAKYSGEKEPEIRRLLFPKATTP